jgi:hypothetical protein
MIAISMFNKWISMMNWAAMFSEYRNVDWDPSPNSNDDELPPPRQVFHMNRKDEVRVL